MRFFKNKKDVNYLWDRKYLLVPEIIEDFCKDKYNNEHLSILFPLLSLKLSDIDGILCEKHFNTFAEVDPNVIIYKKKYYKPVKVGYEYDYEIKEIVKFYIRIDDKVWMPFEEGKYTGVEYYKLYWILNDIEDDMEFDYKNGNLQNVNNICIYAINVPDVDLVTTDLIPKLIENKVEII